MQGRTCLSIVLAAGEGTRMRSTRPKVLHALAGRSLLGHVLAAVRQAGGTATAVVVGPGHEAVAAEAQAACCRKPKSTFRTNAAVLPMPC